jgi:hypothetical protein
VRSHRATSPSKDPKSKKQISRKTTRCHGYIPLKKFQITALKRNLQRCHLNSRNKMFGMKKDKMGINNEKLK